MTTIRNRAPARPRSLPAATTVLDLDANDVAVAYERSARRRGASGLIASGFHPAVPMAIGSIYTLMILSFWIGFGWHGDLGLSLGIATTILVAFVGMPWTLARIHTLFLARHGEKPLRHRRLLSFLSGNLDTYTGRIPADSATILVLTIPTCLCVAAILLEVVYRATA